MDKKDYYLVEYDRLKEEQLKRIESRDHMIYLTLVAVGSVFAYVFTNPTHYEAFLILPFFCIVMAWTYYSNDLKVSAIGDYIKDNIIPFFKTEDLNWESYRYDDSKRTFRKTIQLIIDILLFIGASFLSIIYFINNSLKITNIELTLLIVESIFLIILLILFIIKAFK